MKSLTIFFIIIYNFSSAQKAKEINIKVYLENGINSRLYLNNKPLSMMGPNFKVILYDSALVDHKGYATFKLIITEPTILAIETVENGKWCPFITTPGDSININGIKEKINRSTVSGSKENDLFRNHEKDKTIPIMNSYTGRSMSYDSLKYFKNLIYQSQLDFVVANPKTFSALLLFQDLSTAKFIDSTIFSEAKLLFKKNKSNYTNYELIAKVSYNFFELPFKPKLGDTIKEINLNPKFLKIKNSKTIFTKNKYTLIDFWATWCVPCVSEMPLLDSVNKKFSLKGFNILSISSDVNKSNYNSFLKQKKYKWNFYVDFYGQQSLPIRQFKVDSYPTNFLLDENGVIVAINIKSDKLEVFLKEKLL